jgi:ADP-ribose pyrophosphatase YjhB (NUDIX family)
LADHIELISRGVIVEGEHVLLCVNRKHGYTFLPGGHVEFGESAVDALTREFMEECGLVVRVGPLLLTHEHRFHRPSGPRHEVNLVFHVERGDPCGEVVSRESKIEFRWVEIAKLADANIRPTSMAKWLIGRRETWLSVSNHV